MKEYPILFRHEMVLAILAGQKTQTRRLADLQLDGETTGDGVTTGGYEPDRKKGWGRVKPGDRIWVRETWRTFERPEDGRDGIVFLADGAFVSLENSRKAADLWLDDHKNGRHGENWRPSIYLRRWASRIILEVTEVRSQRLQEISETDALAEGITGPHPVGYPAYRIPGDSKPRYSSALAAFEYAWDGINSERGSWSSDPFVWAISFRLHKLRTELGPAVEAA